MKQVLLSWYESIDASRLFCGDTILRTLCKKIDSKVENAGARSDVFSIEPLKWLLVVILKS